MSGYTVGDLEPGLAGTVMDGTTPVDLSSASTVRAHVQRADGTILSRAVTLGDQGTAPGTWTLAWEAGVAPALGDLSAAGMYGVEIQVDWPGNRPQTFGPSTFHVQRQIA